MCVLLKAEITPVAEVDWTDANPDATYASDFFGYSRAGKWLFGLDWGG